MNASFLLEYGSGNVSGTIMRDVLALGDGEMQFHGVAMGRVNMASTMLKRKIQTDGIFGLGFEALSSIANLNLFAPSTRNSNNSDRLSRFSVYIKELPGCKLSSQFLLGGVDESLVGGKTKVT
uniref:Peptidase A1 domain-containing protein n=1 Tax=Globisporangium ultimum (strain ATCC 200006 / CBS 805.95 / DAOM BR144) TaxID=431595 RepID=K3WF48_GLOUD